MRAHLPSARSVRSLNTAIGAARKSPSYGASWPGNAEQAAEIEERATNAARALDRIKR
jgi:hypothetical protein